MGFAWRATYSNNVQYYNTYGTLLLHTQLQLNIKGAMCKVQSNFLGPVKCFSSLLHFSLEKTARENELSPLLDLAELKEH